MILTFKKLSNRWFIDIPYNGDIGDLEMVEGANTFLNNLPQISEDIVKIEIFEDNNKKSDNEIIKIKEDDFLMGATYQAKSEYYNGTLWICSVTLDLFGEFPDLIKFNILK